MHIPSDLVLLFGLSIAKFQKIESVATTSKPNSQLVIYNPLTNQELNTGEYFSILTGNKRQNSNGNIVELPPLWNPCSCANLLCMCCLGIRFGTIFNHRICASISYDIVGAIKILLQITHNNRIIAQFIFSTTNPPTYCVPILLPLPVSACLRFHDIRAIGGDAQFCLSLVLNALGNRIFEFHFGCIRFGNRGMHFIQRGQTEMEVSPEDDDDEVIFNGEIEMNQKIVLYGRESGK